MTRIEYVYNMMKDVQGKTPILLVGNAMYIFKRLYKGNVYKLENTESIKKFISDFYDVRFDKPIVIEDVSFFYRDTILLKLVEEIKLPLILLASKDNVSEALQSRIKTFIKFPNDNELGCNFSSILESHNYIKDNELTFDDRDKYIAENCPELFDIYKKLEKTKNQDKIIQLLGGLKK